MEHKATPTTTSASKRERSAKKQTKKAMSQARRNLTEKWYPEHTADFGNLANFYRVTKEIARGAYGVCYEAFLLNPQTKQPTTKRVAIKAFYCNLYPQLVLMELFFLKLVKDSPNIVTLENFFVENNQCFVVTDYYPNVHFEKIMRPEGTLMAPMYDIKCYMYALLEGLDVLHDLGVVHRDLKQGNFLYNPETKKGILIDFGLAELSYDLKRRIIKEREDHPKREIYEKIIKFQSQVGEGKIGTEGFMPPEQVLKKSSQSYEVDIWSVGAILLEFLTSRHTLFKNLKIKREKPGNQPHLEYAMGFLCSLALIFGSKKVEEACNLSDFQVMLPDSIQENQIPWTNIVKHPEFDANCEDLLDKMLRLDPSERISAKQALLHPFFDEVRRVPDVSEKMEKLLG